MNTPEDVTDLLERIDDLEVERDLYKERLQETATVLRAYQSQLGAVREQLDTAQRLLGHSIRATV